MNVLRNALIGLLVACFASTAAAGTAEWFVNKQKSKLEFVASIMGGERVGHFSDYDAKITIQPNDLATWSVHLEIDLASATTGHRDIDKALPSGDWFAILDFPKASFTSQAFRHMGDNNYEMDGTLKLRGMERTLTVPFELNVDGDSAHLRGSVEINRTDFGVGQGEFSIGKVVALEVSVVFQLEATKKGLGAYADSTRSQPHQD